MRRENVPAALKIPGGSKATTALALYETGTKIQEQVKQYWRNNFAYTVSVSERDVLYGDIHNWLSEIMPHEKTRSLKVSSNNSADDSPMASDSSGSEIPQAIKPLVVRFDDKNSRMCLIDGHKVNVVISNPEVAGGNSNVYREPEPAKLVFTARSEAGQKAVINHLNRINSQRTTSRKAVLRMVTQWGSWRTRSDLPPRTMDSVSLPAQQKERIMADMAKFLSDEDRYNKLSIPYHRGYMLEGPPGTGKTSLVKGLAAHFNLDMWYISLSDLKAESGLIGLLGEVGPRSILLLEDIDTMKITNEGEAAEQGSISIGSLLNTLDGVATPHGLITIMTTNHFEKIDERLKRAGRMDVVEKLDYPTPSQLLDLFEHFYAVSPMWWVGGNDEPIKGFSVAAAAEIFKQHLDDPVAAEKALWAKIEPYLEGRVPNAGS